MVRRHLANGPAPGGNEVRDTDGNIVVLHGQQADGSYSTIYYDPTTGNPLITIGELTDGDTGIEIRSASGRRLFRVDNVNGQYAPNVLIPALANGSNGVASSTGQFRPGTNSASMVELWRADFYSVGNKITYDYNMFANAGNMTWQMQVYEYPSGLPVTVASGTETTNVQRQAIFTIPTTCIVPDGTGVDDVAGRYMTIRVSALKNSGAATVDVAQNAPFYNHA